MHGRVHRNGRLANLGVTRVDIPLVNTVQPYDTLCGIEPHTITSTRAYVNPAADAARVIVQRSQLEIGGEGVIGPRGTPRIRLSMADSAVSVSSINYGPP